MGDTDDCISDRSSSAINRTGDFTGAPRFFGIVRGPGLRPLSTTFGRLGKSPGSESSILKVFILFPFRSNARCRVSVDHKSLMIPGARTCRQRALSSRFSTLPRTKSQLPMCDQPN